MDRRSGGKAVFLQNFLSDILEASDGPLDGEKEK